MGEAEGTSRQPLTDDYIICIPSYKRLDTFSKYTYGKLLEPYELCSKVKLFLQNDEDVSAYGAKFPGLEIVRSPPGLLNTVNFISDYFALDQKLVLMHDDVDRLWFLSPVGRRTDFADASALDAFIKQSFRILESKQLHLGGVYSKDDPRAAKQQKDKHGDYSTDLNFIHDPFTLLRNQDIKLDIELEQKMDFHRTIEYYKQDGGVLRWNKYGLKTFKFNPEDSESTGGFGHRSAEMEQEAAKKIQDRYPQYVERITTDAKGNSILASPTSPACFDRNASRWLRRARSTLNSFAWANRISRMRPALAAYSLPFRAAKVDSWSGPRAPLR